MQKRSQVCEKRNYNNLPKLIRYIKNLLVLLSRNSLDSTPSLNKVITFLTNSPTIKCLKDELIQGLLFPKISKKELFNMESDVLGLIDL